MLHETLDSFVTARDRLPTAKHDAITLGDIRQTIDGIDLYRAEMTLLRSLGEH